MDLRRVLGRFQGASVDGIVALVIAVFVPVLFKGFRVRLENYPQTELWGSVAIYAMVVSVDFFLLRSVNSSRVGRLWPVVSLAIYGFTALFFVLATLAQSIHVGVRISAAPIYLSLALLGIGLIVRTQLGSMPADFVKEVGGTGLATTSVLIVRFDAPMNFMLVLNRNLNNGKGLWVPPGGHFELGIDDPADRLLQKIRSEVGIEAKIWSPAAPPAEQLHSFNTAQTKWLEAPIFILDEDLLGLCSHGHSRHFDLIYACEATSYIPRAVPKYSVADRILVPVGDCASSVEAAERAVHSAVEGWQRSTAGTTPGVRDTVSRDVAQRLHLVAVEYQKQPAGHARGTTR
jgi:hypothetical protein